VRTARLLAERYKFMLRRLHQARKDAGLAQVEVARALGRRQPFVSKCELGERRIDPLDLQEFAALYRKPLEFFLPPLPRRITAKAGRHAGGA
jgi:transcriptional regulator with XRE-family HTH domain